jgi:hypothetical protein
MIENPNPIFKMDKQVLPALRDSKLMIGINTNAFYFTGLGLSRIGRFINRLQNVTETDKGTS